jgi:predicted  nucleic acid-binding Zn-ribbon protein
LDLRLNVPLVQPRLRAKAVLKNPQPPKNSKKEKKLDLSYVGSPREVRRLRTDLLEGRNTILNLENRIQHMHNVRKEMEIMYENESKLLKKQHENDKKSIEELESQLQSLRRREMDLKDQLAQVIHKYTYIFFL